MKLAGFHPEARAEFLAAIQFYNDVMPDLGSGLMTEVEHALEFAARMPLAGVPVGRTFAGSSCGDSRTRSSIRSSATKFVLSRFRITGGIRDIGDTGRNELSPRGTWRKTKS